MTERPNIDLLLERWDALTEEWDGSYYIGRHPYHLGQQMFFAIKWLQEENANLRRTMQQWVDAQKEGEDAILDYVNRMKAER